MMYDHVVTCDAFTVEWVTVPRRWFRPCGGFLFSALAARALAFLPTFFRPYPANGVWETDSESYSFGY